MHATSDCICWYPSSRIVFEVALTILYHREMRLLKVLLLYIVNVRDRSFGSVVITIREATTLLVKQRRKGDKDGNSGRKKQKSKEVWYLIHPEPPVDQVSEDKARSPLPSAPAMRRHVLTCLPTESLSIYPNWVCAPRSWTQSPVTLNRKKTLG